MQQQPSTAEQARSIVARIKASKRADEERRASLAGGEAIAHEAPITTTFLGPRPELQKARSVRMDLPPDGAARFNVEMADHIIIDVTDVNSVEELDRRLYEERRRRRIQTRLQHEQELKEGRAQHLAFVDELVIALGGTIGEQRSPFDCLYEPWTMASWPTPDKNT